MIKFLILKNLKTIPLPIKFVQQFIIKPFRRFSDPWGWKNMNNNKKMRKIEKKLQDFSEKSFQTLEEVFWLSRLRKPKKFSKNLKKITSCLKKC